MTGPTAEDHAALLERVADLEQIVGELEYLRAAVAAEGYDSPEETHRRLVRVLEYVTGTLAEGTDQPYTEALEHIEERLTRIIRDMPANRTREQQ